jgi:hypothetical protein
MAMAPRLLVFMSTAVNYSTRFSFWEDMMLDWPLTPPTQLTLIISLLIAIFACLVHWLHIAVPPFETGFVVLVVGYLVLLAGNVFRGL